MISIEYLAGFFDAEGYVGVVKLKGGFGLRCTLTNTNELVMQKIQSEFGGKLYSKWLSNPEHNHQKVLTWHGEECKEFLNMIKNYTIIKRTQIDLALTFPIGEHNKNDEKEYIYKELRKMKQVRKEV